VVTLYLCLPYLIGSSLIYLFISIGCCPRILISGLMSGSALGSVSLIVAAAAGSPDISPSAFDCPLGLRLPAYLAISIFSCVRADCSNGSQE